MTALEESPYITKNKGMGVNIVLFIEILIMLLYLFQYISFYTVAECPCYTSSLIKTSSLLSGRSKISSAV